MHKLMQNASACDASQPHSSASRQSLKSNAATAGSIPTTQACRAVSGDFSISLVQRMQEEQPRIVFTGEVACSTCLFWAHNHSTSFQDQITKDVSCPCRILTWAQVWSRCSGSSHGCQYYRRFCKAEVFELSMHEKSTLTIPLPPRQFSLSSLHFRCFRNIAKGTRSWSLFSLKVKITKKLFEILTHDLCQR